MNKLVFLGSGVIIVILISISIFFTKENTTNFEKNNFIQNDLVFDLNYNPSGNRKNLDDVSEIFLQYSYEEDQNIDGSYRYTWFEPKNESLTILNELKNESKKTVVILPVFTHSAYVSDGFYSYYEQKCSKDCLTVKIEREQPPQYNSGKNAIQILKILNYSFISDIEVDKNPDILKKYDKIILLHNEYVTQTEFDAITSHSKVIYLYPNSLYAQIEYDSKKDSISLIRGHGFPSSEIDNGFNWEFDNTRPDEFNTECKDWKFIEIPNGIMLNCYPEQIIWQDKALLKKIKEF
ncbi:MAG: hypothetical protein ISR79_05735 [Nitrosopumilus sp.]|nr:hypothetical protein [Nitrosopumilus sp.]